MTIRPLGGASAGAASAAPRRSGVAGFSLPAALGGPAAADATAEAAPVAATGLDALLSLQEVEPAHERDRRARRHAESMLELLSGLQRSLLGDGEAAASLGAIDAAGLAAPMAADPRLRAVVDAITLRAHVEKARQEMAVATRAGGAGKRTA